MIMDALLASASSSCVDDDVAVAVDVVVVTAAAAAAAASAVGIDTNLLPASPVLSKELSCSYMLIDADVDVDVDVEEDNRGRRGSSYVSIALPNVCSHRVTQAGARVEKGLK